VLTITWRKWGRLRCAARCRRSQRGNASWWPTGPCRLKRSARPNALVHRSRLFWTFFPEIPRRPVARLQVVAGLPKCVSRGLSPPASTCCSTPGMLLEISERVDQAFRIDQSQRLPGFVRLFSCALCARYFRGPLSLRFVSLISVHGLHRSRAGDSYDGIEIKKCALDWTDVARRRNPKGL
jgi:hypothetical protein